MAERDLNAKTRYIPKPTIPSLRGKFSEKIAIVGAGPAGLSCAYFLAEKGYQPVIFEKNEKPGGMLTYGVPSFKLEKDLIEAEIDVIKAMGVEIKCGIEVGVDVTIQQLRDQGYKGFYIAIGCQGGRVAGIRGEDAKGVYTAVEFCRRLPRRNSLTLAEMWLSLEAEMLRLMQPEQVHAAVREKFRCFVWRAERKCRQERKKSSMR